MIPLYKPFVPGLPDLQQILQSGNLAYGKYTKQFEELLRDYFGTPYVLVTNSFNTAISVVLNTLDIGYGDEIIASPMACLASTQPYLSSGLKVKWADVDPTRGTLNPESVLKQISSKTKAIVHNHFCGYPGYIDEINAIGRERGIAIIDDGIECFGSEYKKSKIGSNCADVAIFSCNPVRIPNTVDGGIIVFNNAELFNKSLLIRDCGIDRSKFRDELGEIIIQCDIKIVGYSATMSNVNGYIGAMQMNNVTDIIDKQRKQANKWDAFFEEQSTLLPIRCDNALPNYWVYGILSNNKSDTIMKFRNMGYYASGVHMRNDIYSVFGKGKTDLPGVEEFFNKFVALPCGWWME